MPEGIGNGLMRQAVSGIIVRTNATPDVRIDPWAAPGGAPAAGTGGGPGGLILRLLQPEIVVQSAAGPIPIRPWGEPTGAGGAVAIILLAGAVYLAARALRLL